MNKNIRNWFGGQLHDASGQTVGRGIYTHRVASAPQKADGYRNGELLITTQPGANIRRLVTDQLGTPWMVFDQTGSLANISRHDYLPFGEELADCCLRDAEAADTASNG